MSSLDLNSQASNGSDLRRVNRLPIIVVVALFIVFSSVVVWGLSDRGSGRANSSPSNAPGMPASDLADALTEGVRPGIVEAPRQDLPRAEPPAAFEPPLPANSNPFQGAPELEGSREVEQIGFSQTSQRDEGWQDALARELAEAELRERNRQHLASLQAQHTAASSPLSVDLSAIEGRQTASEAGSLLSHAGSSISAQNGSAILSEAIRARLAQQMDFLHDSALNGGPGEQGTVYDRNDDSLVPAHASPFALARGSVIPATLISAINSDLPGPISAQVRQHVYDSATGHHLLIPQGSRLVGRYESNVGFGQTRVYAVWSDIVFPDGTTLELGDMSGMDGAGRRGFSDRVDNRYLETFGAAALTALLGTGLDLASPRPDPGQGGDLWSTGRSNIADSFGRVAEQTISRSLDVSPTLEIRSGYRFNIFVERDITFPIPYGP
ncbi:IncP-type conjugal transfer protein TrbI [Pelagibacterium luteolum]|uniref:Type IV secretion system protein VirB10 n=1 Tax=Pelagibacterium luteolum TaxID=440168 RepID=A0A1G7ZYX3_9HYPH|nr:IncP-type conjugal transfer protein TrbI [Pelagibacterium luteolum]SDH13852.1 type IV secretion system protein VirB10 [Pelagibacterium luteolum]